MDSLKIKKYKLGGLICKNVFTKLKHEICKYNKQDVLELTKLGNALLEEESNLLAKKYNLVEFIETIKIAFPTCISLNNCTGHYVYEENLKEYNFIDKNDLVKIELGINIDNCINVFGDSFYISDESGDKRKNKQMFDLLDKLEYKITKSMNTNCTNDDVKMLIESSCTEYNCFPVENTFSYQHLDSYIMSDESKYIVTNHKKYYNDDDILLTNPDICFDFEENEVYTVNLTIIENKNDDINSEHVYKELHNPHLYNYNEYYHNFKLQSSKQFYSFIKKKHGNNVFSMTDYRNNAKNKLGFKESLDNGLLNYYPVLYNKENLPVFFKKFTVIVGKEKGTNLNE